LEKVTIREYIRSYFPGESDAFIENILWGETGWPGFWNIPREGLTPRACFEMQVARAAARENFGEFGYFDSEYYLARLPAADHGEMAAAAGES
jgi:hypothetical protein